MKVNSRKLNIDLSCYAKNDEEPSNTILTSGKIQTTSNDALMRYFSKFGQVVDIVRSRESRDAFGRFAFIVFRRIKHASKVLKAGPHLIDGLSMDCRRARNFESGKSIKKTDSVPSLTSSSKSSLTESVVKLHIANLSSNTTVEMIKNHFSQFGIVHDAYIPLHYCTTDSKGIGYVVMNTKDVKFNFSSQAIKGRTLKISKICSDDAPPPSEKSQTLLVSAGPDTMGKISEADLQLFFSKFGEIKSVRKFKNRATQSSSHYAFVEYKTEKAVEAAISKFYKKLHIADILIFSHFRETFVHHQGSHRHGRNFPSCSTLVKWLKPILASRSMFRHFPHQNLVFSFFNSSFKERFENKTKFLLCSTSPCTKFGPWQ